MTLQEFSPVFVTLASQLRATDADEFTIRTYYAALKDVPIEFLSMAAIRMATTLQWFPKTSEWLTAAGTIEAERIAHQREILRKMAGHLCLACDDTGWEQVEGSVKPCDCRAVRRLEVLGRRPWPALPEASL